MNRNSYNQTFKEGISTVSTKAIRVSNKLMPSKGVLSTLKYPPK